MMTRGEIVDKYFLNLEMSGATVDIFVARSAILNFLKSELANFRGEILDVGCGIMPYRELILNQNRLVSKYTGLDFENALDGEYALGRPDLFWDGTKIPLPDKSVDVVIATELFEHCPDPKIVMLEMNRVLKPSGFLFFTVPFIWNLHLVPHDEYRYTPFSMARLLSESGFSNIILRALGAWDASLAQMIGIWHKQRPMRPIYNKILAPFVVGIIKRLLKSDVKFRKSELFAEGGMMTGIGGTAYKK